MFLIFFLYIVYTYIYIKNGNDYKKRADWREHQASKITKLKEKKNQKKKSFRFFFLLPKLENNRKSQSV